MNPINTIVTGSRKYGQPRNDSDIDVVVFVTPEVEGRIWGKAFDAADDLDTVEKCVFDQVGFVQHDPNPLIRDLRASVTFPDHGGVDVLCIMSEEDERLLGGLHKWVKTKNKHGGFRSTMRNNNVNLVPTDDPERFEIWKQGTQSLLELSQAGMEIDRAFAIETFTSFGMPRLQS